MYIVTGGAGFIGSAFVAKLNSMGLDDILIVDELGCSDKWKNLRGLKFRDYLHKDELLEQIHDGHLDRDVEAIIHMGACSATTERDVDFLYQNNFEYSRILALFSLDREIRFIYASSAATYGAGELGYSDSIDDLNALRPLNPYGYSKLLFDQWADRKGLFDKIVGLKFFNVYGPNEYHKEDMRSVVHKAFGQVHKEGTVKLFKSYKPEYGDGEQKRDFVYVKDCCEVMSWFLEKPDLGGLFNVGSGKARSWVDLATAVFKASGVEPNIEFIEMPEEIRGQYQYFTEAPMTKLTQLGYSKAFHSLEEGVKDYVSSYLQEDEVYLGSSNYSA